MLTNLVSYVLIGFFLVLQRMLRKGSQAKGVQPNQEDKGSTRFLGMAFGFCLLAVIVAPILNSFEIARLDFGSAVGWAGVTLMIGGLALRCWASAVLERFYTSTLRLAENQQIVKKGPYRFVRHPGYAGVLLLWLGAGLASQNWLVAALILPLMSVAYAYRIKSEESMLVSAFGTAYRGYMASTWRLVPWVF
jgi:protein-S-isoprenylcysteine O-methyltransferase